MENIWIKFINRLFIVAMFLGACIHVEAQNALKEIMARVDKVNNANKITYSYTVELFSVEKNKYVDSIKGRLFREGKNYFDSSNTELTVVSGKYCLKIQRKTKTATLFDLDYLHRKIGFEQSSVPQAFIIPDTEIIRHGKMHETAGEYIIEVAPSSRQFSTITATVRKSDFKILSMTFETKESNKARLNYIRRYRIDNIHDVFNSSVFDISRFMSINNKAVKLNNSYVDFKVKTITG
jgi:uncharacterized protein YhbP (UPF0306 family)